MSRLSDVLRRPLGALREVIWPEGAICLGCGRVSRGECLCPACRQELLNSDLLDSWEFRDLGGVPAWSMRPHRGLQRELILRLKHGAEARAATELAGILRTRPGSFPAFPPETVVTWVPTPGDRLRERCVDHGRLLAQAVGKELGLPCRQLLARRGSDTPQAKLNREARQRNLQKAFVPVERITAPVLLVDDVLTTGTTAMRCLEALREGGAAELAVLTVTWAAR